MKKLSLFIALSILFSRTLFAQWVYTNGPAYNYVLCLGVSDSTLFAGTWGDGVYRTTNSGQSWIQTGLTYTAQVNVIAPYGTNLFAGIYPYAVALSTNNGTSWTIVNNGLTNDDVDCLAASATNLFAGSYLGGVFLSTNNGTSWSAVNNGLYNYDINALAIYGTNLFAGTHGDGVFLSTNNGTSWSTVNNGLFNYYILDLAISGTNIFAATYAGVYLSTNNGTSWNNIGLTGYWVLCLVVSDTYIFAGTIEDGVFLSTNNGTSWTAVNEGLFNYYIRDLAIYGTNLFAGTDGSGVWRRPLDEMIPVELTSFTATANGNEVILSWATATELNNQGFEIQRSTEGEEFFTVGFVNGYGTTTEQHNYNFSDRNLDDGKYYYRLKQVDYDGSYEYSDIVEVEWRAFISYLLEQNYPNPFNPTTTIGFGIQNKSNVKITILNAIGEEVAVVLNEEKEPGFHQVEFNAASLPSGVYFYQLKAGEFVSTKKMLLLK